MKKKLTLLLIFTLTLTLFAIPAFASDEIKLEINGTIVTPSVAPVIENGTTLVPLRIISENLGATVEWDGTVRQVNIAKDETKIVLTIDKTTAIVNDMDTTLLLAPKIINGSTMVPIRFVSENLGVYVNWDGSSRTVQVSATNDFTKPEIETPVNPATVTIGEKVLVNESGVKITVKGLETDGIFGPEIKLLIENNSGKDLTFQCRNTSVNGYMVETMMSVDVANGKKVNDSMTFMESDFEECGIKAIADIETKFHIFDTAEWESYLDTDTIRIETSIIDSFKYTYDDSGDLVYEGNGVKIVIKELAEDESIFGPSIITYVENNGNKDITVQTRDVSINGFMVDAMFSCDVSKGKRAVDTITFMDSDLEENGITSIEDVELYFHIFDSDEWETIVDTGIININF